MGSGATAGQGRVLVPGGGGGGAPACARRVCRYCAVLYSVTQCWVDLGGGGWGPGVGVTLGGEGARVKGTANIHSYQIITFQL